MYRSNVCILGKTKGLLCSRSHVATVQTGFLLRAGSIKHKGSRGQFMSTVSKEKSRNYYGYSVGFITLLGGAVTYLSKENERFRKAVEDTIPLSKTFFSYVIPRRLSGREITIDDLTTRSQLEEDIQVSGESKQEEQVCEKKDDDGAFLNVMDVPSPSQIDFEIAKEHVQNESGTHPEEIQIPQGDSGVFSNVMDVPLPSQIDIDVGKEHVTEHEGGIVRDESEVIIAGEMQDIGGEIEVEIDSEALKNKIAIQHQTKILTTAYENLKIIVDDTITTKTSAASMLQGYITQFAQALLVPKENLAYESIWDANSALEHSIQESISLIRSKESEVNFQVKNIKVLIDDIRERGSCELADKAEELIASADESLLRVESEIKLFTRNVDILQEFRHQCVECPESLQKDLHMFIPDLIKLLNLKHIDVLNLSYQDALLLLSLKRSDLIYAEVQEKEAEQKLQFEATLQTLKENLQKEASERHNDTIDKLLADKDNELTEKIEDLKELHEKDLHEELKMQYEAHQQNLHDAQTKLISELTAKYETELELMLNEQEDRHYHEVMTNISHLKGIESKIGDVLDIDAKLVKNQHLWAAVDAFNTALNKISDSGRTKELTPEISNILQANHNDGILHAIVSTVPEPAASLGVIPENALMQHFSDIKRICKRVAMVKDEGGSISAYVYSYIKSFFVISRFYRRRASDEIDLESLGTYEILEKADYYIQQGDLEQAVKFMCQLKGVPRKLSSDWIKEVRLLLETKQSADLLLAYAAGSLIGFE